MALATHLPPASTDPAPRTGTNRLARRAAHLLLAVGAGVALIGVQQSALAQETGEKKQPDAPPAQQPQPQPTTPTSKPVTPAGKPLAPQTPPTTRPAASPSHTPAQPESSRPLPPPEPDENHWVLNLTGEVSLANLIREVQRDMNIQILFADAGVQDQKVVLTAPLKIRKEQMLDFISRLLDSKGYTLLKDDLGIYTVTPTTSGQIAGGGVASPDPYTPTQVIDCKGIKPSSVVNLVPALGAGGAGGQIVPLDEFGVLIVTDTSARTKLIRDFVNQLVSLRNGTEIIPLDVAYVSAATARDRMLALTGEASPGSSASGPAQVPGGVVNKPGAVPVPGTITGATTTSNLAAQLSVSPFSNALFFKGRPEELPYVRQLLALVDVPNRMKAEWYDIGMRAAEIISAMGVREGLGEVTVQEASSDPASPLASSGTRLNQPSTSLQPGGLIGSQQQPSGLAGAGFVIFPEPGGFMYYGTVEQHARVKELIDGNKMLTVGEQIVYKFYKLKNTKAVEVADIISALVNNQQPIGNTGNIIGNDLSRGNSSRSRSSSSRSRGSRTQDPNQANQPGRVSPSGTAGGIGGIEAGEDTFVMPDEKQNQIIVKTRAALQPEFAKLIEKLDARRPQVYIEAQIVAVTDNQNSRLAIETQLFAGQFGLNTNFGLGTLNNFLDRKNVSTSLPALTAAIIQSDKVPFIITALQNNTDGRVLATPQLLVDDNEPATVTSDTIVQTQVTTTIDSQPQVSVGEPVSAGTELTVTPQISENAVKLEVFVRQSAFIGSGTATLPPDQQENIIDTGSVTVPRDATIVIGGLSTENIGKTVVKVPLLGDIPLVGLLFRDTTNTRQRTKLYVFITPRIMRDQNFMDARLLSQGPAREASIQSDFILPAPELLTSPIDMPPAPPAPPAPPGPPTPPAVAPSGSGTPGAGPETSSSGSPIPPPQPIGAEIEKNKP